MDTLCNTVVVDKATTSSTYTSQIQPITLDYEILKQSDALLIKEMQTKYVIQASKKSSLQLQVNNPKKILIISFTLDDVLSQKESDTTITINGIKNKLSSLEAPYPNNNYQFTYVLSANEDITTLDIELSKGEYSLTNVELYTMDYSAISTRYQQVDALKHLECTGKQILSGSIDVTNTGYFVTTIPYQKGMVSYVDGEGVEIEKVNTAFVGFAIEKGSHTIAIEFHAPGKGVGYIVSLLGVIGTIVLYSVNKKYVH